GVAYTFTGRARAGAEKLHLAIDIAAGVVALDDPQWHAWTAMCNLYLRESGARRDLLEQAAEVARSRTALGVLVYLLCYLAVDHATADRWPEAEAGFHQVVALARETGHRTDLSAALARLAWLEARQGRSEQSRLHAGEALGLSREMGLGVSEVWAITALGERELTLGRADAALARF